MDTLYWKLHSPALEYDESVNYRAGSHGEDVFNTESLYPPRTAGIRLGLGYRFCSNWDVTWNYTYYHTAGVAAGDPNLDHIYFGNEENYQVFLGRGHSSFKLNVNDLEIGHWFCLDDHVDLRLFGGFRYAAIRSDVDTLLTYGGAPKRSTTPAASTRTACASAPSSAGGWARRT